MIKKKRRIKKKIIFSFIIIIFICLCVIVGALFLKNRLNSNSKEKRIIVKQKLDEIEKHYEASVIAVGDSLIHSTVYYEANKYANGGYANLSTNKFDFTPMYPKIKEIVKNYDIAYYNQETILGGTELGLSSYPLFNSPYEAADGMLDAGFNLVSLATNHTMDMGSSGVVNSCNYWKTKEDVLSVGSYCSNEEREEIRIFEKNNITYTMLNYTYGTNGMPVYEDYQVNVWPTNVSINNPELDTEYQNYKEQVKLDVEKVRDKVDILMVAMHWGVEYTHTPTLYEEDMAKYLASLGVDVIIGTHPHVIQPVTWIGDTLVIYSLGNFISAQWQNENVCYGYKCVIGLMTNFKIEKTVKGKESSVKITNVENELIYNYFYQPTWSGYNIIPFSDPEIADKLPNYKNIYENYKAVVKAIDPDMIVKEAY